jgi:two-component system response regulator QseB
MEYDKSCALFGGPGLAAPMNILFIEDDPMNRRVVKDMLDVAGATMSEAELAEEGLARIEQQDFDVVLVDLRMPGMDGMEAIRRIRARGDAKAELPIIVVTADTAIDLREQCLQAGADDVLFKPVAMDALFDSIGRVLAQRGSGSGMML